MDSQNTNNPQKDNAILSSSRLMEFFFKTLDVVMESFIKDKVRPPGLFFNDKTFHRFADIDGQDALEAARKFIPTFSQGKTDMYVVVADGYINFEDKKCNAVIFEIGERGTNFGERFSQRYQNESETSGTFQILGNPMYIGKTENYYKKPKEDSVGQFQPKNKVQKWIKVWSSRRSSRVGVGKILGIFIGTVVFGFIVSTFLSSVYYEVHFLVIFAATYAIPVGVTCILFSYYPPNGATLKIKMTGMGMGVVAVYSALWFFQIGRVATFSFDPIVLISTLRNELFFKLSILGHTVSVRPLDQYIVYFGIIGGFLVIFFLFFIKTKKK